MIKNTLYVYNDKDGYTLYFLYDAANYKWVGGRHFRYDEDVHVVDFRALCLEIHFNDPGKILTYFNT